MKEINGYAHLTNRNRCALQIGTQIDDERLRDGWIPVQAHADRRFIPFPWFLLLGCNRQAQDGFIEETCGMNAIKE